MPIKGVTPKCYILSLFVRDDGERFVLGSGYYEFKDKQMHFKANTVANDIVEVQGNDGYLLAGQVRRPGSQDFDGFVGDGTVDKAEVEQKRRDFLAFFRKNHFYKVVYVFSDGTAIQRKRGFLVDDPTVKELYQIYPEYHVALNFEDVNYYSYAEDGDGEEIYSKIAEIQLTQSVATGGLIWDEDGVVWDERQWGGTPASAGGSTSFTVDNQAGKGAPLASIQLNGDTFQQTYSGKNLLDNTNLDYTASNVGTDKNHLSTIDTGIRYTTTNPGGTPIVRWTTSLRARDYAGKTVRMRSSFGAGGGIRLGYSNSDGSSFTNTVGSTTSGEEITWTIPSSISAFYYVCFVLECKVSAATTVDYTNLILTIDEPTTPFEPYTNGPSPNPDYPQDINVVTGEQTVEVTGKNLLDGSNPTFASQLTSSSLSGNTITISTTNTSTQPYCRWEIPVSQGDVVRLNTIIKNSNGMIARQVWNGSSWGGYVSKNYTDGTSISSLEYTATSGIEKIAFYFYPSTTIPTGAVSASYGDAIVTKNNSDMAYEPYQGATYPIDLGSTELAKIGTYVDGIFKNDPTKSWYNPDLEDNAWYVHKATGKTIVTGSSSETWATVASENTGNTFYASCRNIDSDGPTQTGRDGLISNYFVQISNIWSGDDVGSQIIPSQGWYSLRFRILKTDLATVDLDGVKAWFAAHNTTVYYLLATPTDTKITDATLIGELEATKALKLYAGENNFLVAASGTNLPGPLDITYYTQVIYPGGAEWSEGAPMGPTTVEVDSIDIVFPVWTVTGPAVNPQLSVLTTNTTFKYNGTVSASQTLVVDMMNKTVLLNGVNMIGNMEGDWASFNPGTNRVMYTTDNTDAEASVIEWQEIVG